MASKSGKFTKNRVRKSLKRNRKSLKRKRKTLKRNRKSLKRSNNLNQSGGNVEITKVTDYQEIYYKIIVSRDDGEIPINFVGYFIEKVKPFTKEHCGMVNNFLENCVKSGVAFPDLHADNIGIIGEDKLVKLVITDFGVLHMNDGYYPSEFYHTTKDELVDTLNILNGPRPPNTTTVIDYQELKDYYDLKKKCDRRQFEGLALNKPEPICKLYNICNQSDGGGKKPPPSIKLPPQTLDRLSPGHVIKKK